MDLDVPIQELARPQTQKDGGRKKPAIGVWKTAIDENAQRELKLIGMRVDEALTILEPFISHAAAAGLSEVRVIHGVGTGRLRDAVREELGRHPLVEGFRSGEPHEGRDGATVVTLKT
jgi:DNA mismatch repair protein MutS2